MGELNKRRGRVLGMNPAEDGLQEIVAEVPMSEMHDFATLIRVKHLKDLEKGNYEDVYASFLGGGTPYSLTQIDDRYYLTEHRLPGHSIWSFRVENDEITDVEAVY